MCRSLGRHSGGFVVYVTERVYFVCAGHLAGILVGLLYMIICDGEDMFCVCRSLGRHSGGFVIYDNM